MRDEINKSKLRDVLNEETEVTTRMSEKELREIIAARLPVKDKTIKSQLIVLSGAEAGKIYLLDSDEMVGRDLNASIRVSDTTVSRKHVRIVRASSGKYTIEDLGSQNGTWVNGVPVVRRISLKVGDKIRLGVKTVFLFTQQDNIEMHLLELRKMESLGRLARGIAHDFNNLLATVMLNINYIEVMSDEGAIDSEELAVSIDQTKIALRQAANMTEQLLGFARKGRYDERPRNVSTIIEETVALIRRTFDRAISIETDLKPDLWVVGDQSQLIQVLMNLCINARDAMPSGGKLKIAAYLEQIDARVPSLAPFLTGGPHVVISVADTGVGMDEETVQHIFEPFFSTKGLGKGNGLGLATVYGVVKNHGGEIRVDSELGKGTQFTVYLPSSDGSLTADENRPVEHGIAGPAPGGVILLVEDDVQLRTITEKTLTKLGYTVQSCEDGVEALRIYNESKHLIKLVLLDLILPKMGGYEVFRRIKSMTPDAKVVIISGYSEDQQLRDILAEGASAFVKKPCSFDQLAATIADVLSADLNDNRARVTMSCTSPYK